MWSWFFLNDVTVASRISMKALSSLCSNLFFKSCSTLLVLYDSSQIAQTHPSLELWPVYEAHMHAFCLASFFPFLEIKKVNLISQCWLCTSVLSLFQVLSQLAFFLEAYRNHYAVRGDVVMLFVCLSEQQQQGGGARVRNNSHVIAAKCCQVNRYLKICVFFIEVGPACL